MKKKMKSIFCIMLMAIMLLPVTAQAKYTEVYETKIVNLPQKTQVRATDYVETYNDKIDTSTLTATMYKISIPSQGYMVLNTNNAEVAVNLFKKFTRNQDLDRSTPIYDFYGSKRYYAVLPKGTYYLHADDKVTMQWKFIPIAEQKNYCRSYAKKLAAGKAELVLFPYGREHAKWYKIELTQDRAITVKAKCIDEDTESIYFSIYNKTGKRIASPVGSSLQCRTPKLMKGTYYVAIYREEEDSDDDHYLSRIAGISWR